MERSLPSKPQTRKRTRTPKYETFRILKNTRYTPKWNLPRQTQNGDTPTKYHQVQINMPSLREREELTESQGATGTVNPELESR